MDHRAKDHDPSAPTEDAHRIQEALRARDWDTVAKLSVKAATSQAIQALAL